MNNGYKNDINHYIDITPVVDMKGFATLLLADLASKEEISQNGEVKHAHLPMDYKNRIEKIMYEENEWGIKFSGLLDINEYYEHQIDWEQELGKTISNVINELGKKDQTTYNLELDTIEIIFTDEEIKEIKSRYDEETLEIMDHFSNLIDDYSFSRELEIDRREMDRNSKRRINQQHNFLIYQLRSIGIRNPEKYLHF